MTYPTLLIALLSLSSLVSSTPIEISKRAAGERIVGYYMNWASYRNGNKLFDLSSVAGKLSHVNYAFATVSYSQNTKSYYVDFTDTWADYQQCAGGATNCYGTPPDCISLTNSTCTGGNLPLAPYMGAFAGKSCPAPDTCYNKGGAVGYPRACGTQVQANVPGYVCGQYNYVLRKAREHPGVEKMRMLLSIGGWYDSNYFSPATEETNIDSFIESIVQFIRRMGFDGVDLDWEYPGFEHGGEPVIGGPSAPGNGDALYDCTATTCAYPQRRNDGTKFTNLIKGLRKRFDALGKNRFGDPYEISIAAPAGVDKIEKLDVGAVCDALTFVNLMTYDMAGSWSLSTNHQAPIHDNTPKDLQGKYTYDLNSAVDEWTKRGCPAKKLHLGIPFYARTFNGVDPGPSNNGLYQKFDATRIEDPINYGVLTTQPGWQTFYDTKSGASYAYNAGAKKFATFDSPQAVREKKVWARSKGLGGFMVWALGQDDAQGSLMNALIS